MHPNDVEFVNMTHHSSDHEYVYVVFAVTNWQGDPRNIEPQKCDDLRWFDIDNLPVNITNGAKEAVQNLLNKKYYTEEGWS